MQCFKECRQQQCVMSLQLEARLRQCQLAYETPQTRCMGVVLLTMAGWDCSADTGRPISSRWRCRRRPLSIDILLLWAAGVSLLCVTPCQPRLYAVKRLLRFTPTIFWQRGIPCYFYMYFVTEFDVAKTLRCSISMQYAFIITCILVVCSAGQLFAV